MIVATAGHIDHGKTTLVRALTGVDTDRLPEEKARGISIDLGFAYWRTPGDALTVGFVDVPGHERFVRNMLAGVCGIDFVMIIVAADDGIMPQTVEHLNIVELLSVSRGVAVITKADRVSTQRLAEVQAHVKTLLAPTGLAGIDVLHTSAVSGEGIEALRSALANAARALGTREQQGRHLRFAIDRVFSIAGSGTVATGTVFSGAVSAGDKLVLTPSGIEVRVRAIQAAGATTARAVAGERCALNLTGVDLADVGRGDWVVSAPLHVPTQRIDVRLRLLDAETRPLKHWTPVHLHHGARDITARVAIRRGAEILPGESGIAQLIIDAPMTCQNGDRFIVRDQSALRTIGGGVVLDPAARPLRRNRDQRVAQLAAIETADPAAALIALLPCTPAGVDLGWFGRVFNLDEARLAEVVQGSGLEVIGKDPALGLPASTVATIKTSVRQNLARFLADNPQSLGIEVAELRGACAPHLAAPTFALVLRLLADEKHLELTGSIARLPRHVATDNPADEKMWQSVQPVLLAAGFSSLTLTELAAAASVKEPLLKDFMHRKAKTGEVIRVTPDRFYTRGTLAQFAAVATAAAAATADGKFSAAQVRDRTDIGRTRAIEILESLDRLGITRRIGDVRVLHKDFAPILGPGIAPPLPEPAARADSPAKPKATAAPGAKTRHGGQKNNRYR